MRSMLTLFADVNLKLCVNAFISLSINDLIFLIFSLFVLVFFSSACIIYYICSHMNKTFSGEVLDQLNSSNVTSCAATV